MAMATGVFNTTQNPSELNVRSFAEAILRLFPNGSAPMFALTSQSGKSRAKSSTHGYFSKTMAFLVITMGTTALAGDATISKARGRRQGGHLQHEKGRGREGEGLLDRRVLQGHERALRGEGEPRAGKGQLAGGHEPP